VTVACFPQIPAQGLEVMVGCSTLQHLQVGDSMINSGLSRMAPCVLGLVSDAEYKDLHGEDEDARRSLDFIGSMRARFPNKSDPPLPNLRVLSLPYAEGIAPIWRAPLRDEAQLRSRINQPLLDEEEDNTFALSQILLSKDSPELKTMIEFSNRGTATREVFIHAPSRGTTSLLRLLCIV